MKIINETTNDLTIEMTDTDLKIIDQTFGVYVFAMGAHKLTRHTEYSFLSDLDVKLLSNNIGDQLSISESLENSSLDHVNNNNNMVSVTLNKNEWALCLFFLIDSTYGCIISENDLFCTSGYHRHEIIEVMIKLHEQLEKTVFHLMGTEKVKIKKANR